MISEHSAFQPIAIEYPFQKRHDKRHPPRLWVSRRQSGWFERVSIVPCPLSWPHCGVTVWWWKQILVRFIGFWNDFNEIVQIISITITVMMNCVDAFVLFNNLFFNETFVHFYYDLILWYFNWIGLVYNIVIDCK